MLNRLLVFFYFTDEKYSIHLLIYCIRAKHNLTQVIISYKGNAYYKLHIYIPYIFPIIGIILLI
jgi:hypothetical protein